MPAHRIETPMVFAENIQKSLPVPLCRRLRRRGTDLRRIVADVVIAGQIAAGNRQRIMQRFGEFEIGGAVWAVKADVAGVDDKIRPLPIDIFRAPDRNWRSMSEDGAQDAYRKFASGEIRACTIPPGAIISSPEVGIVKLGCR
jgi:hypothetical protein